MKNNKLTNSLVIGLILILLFSTASSFAISEVLQQKNGSITLNRCVTFISKSSGLETPDKEEGKTELELADINNDGHLDIICVGDHGSPYVNSGQHGIMVWLGDGDDTWSVSQVGDFGYGGCEAGDLNLDGYLDVVWGIHHDWGDPGFGDTLIGAALGDGTGSNWTGWATGLGTGGESWGMFATDLADFDCNGLLDIISQSFGCCNGYHMYENHGDGTWSHEWSLSGGNTYNNIEIGDFNADGYPDFAGNREGTYVFFGDGSFDFTMNQDGLPSVGWNGLDCGDMNNDGFDDLVIAYSSAGVRCYKFDEQNDKWVLVSDGLPTSGTYYPQFGDIDGDGFLDIVAYIPPTGYVYLGDGNGNWESDATFTMSSDGGYSAFVVDGDFDHDGREDVVIQARQGSWPSYENKLKAYSPWLEPTELTVLVSRPNGGETFISGSIRKIRWLSAVSLSQENANVEIQLSLNGNSGPWRTTASNLPNNGCYQWLVDACGSEQSRIKIIVSTSSENASAVSLSDFTTIGFNVNTHGPYQGGMGEPLQFIGSAENGTQPYEYHWDFGDGNTSDEQNATHIYDTDGNFTVILSVTDGEGITIRDSTWALILGDNSPPSAPIIKGPTSGKPGVQYEYTFNSTDDDNDDLYYIIDWGDGIEEVIGVFPSGVEANASHTWAKKGTFTIRAKAGDPWGALSEWGSLTVTMPKDKQIIKSVFSKLLENFPAVNLLIKYLLIFKFLL
ncbi:MAG: VCBS repeat-containing protein [Thermoplasmatales archaeon]|nr:MAG: VCBS repeat-containing protein [Thermoplasmatales archaeon]